MGLELECQDHAVAQQVASDNIVINHMWKDVEHSGKGDIIQCVIYMLILRCSHGHLG